MFMRRKKGFTLIELMIVVVILGILASIALPRFMAQIQKARRSEAIATMRSIADAERAYYSINGTYDSDFSGTTIAVDLDGDNNDDISVPTSSASFTYTMPNSTTGTAYIGAAATNGSTSYSMCVESGKTAEATGASAPALVCP